jgi:hypothetical protein
MCSYRAAPCRGHLDRLKRMYGIKRNPHRAIRFRVNIPDHESQYMPTQHDWSSTVHGNMKDERPSDMPTPKGKTMRTTTNQDANLHHDIFTGRVASGIIQLLNQTPVYWFCKKQKTVETATYGSEFLVTLSSNRTSNGFMVHALNDGHSN